MTDQAFSETKNVPKKLISFRENIAYGAGDMASVFFFKVFSSFLMFFYTDIIGISAAVIGTMFIATRIFDAVNDPVMGMVCDRTKSPHGKFRPWLRWTVIPFAISGIAVFTVPEANAIWQIAYAYVTYTLAMLFYTAINIPYGALMGVMTPHSKERTVLAGFRFVGAFGANLIVQGTILFLVIELGGSSDGETGTQMGYVNTMIIYAACAAALFLFTFYGTKERVQPPKNQRNNFRDDLSVLFKNKPWVSILFIGISTVVWIAMRDAAILYYFKYYVVGQVEDGGRFAKLATLFNVLGSAATLIGLYFTNRFANLFGGKRNAYFSLTLITAVIASGYYFADQGDIVLIVSIQMITSFLMGPLMPLFWSMIADTADYSEWKDGRRMTGLIFSAGTFSQKMGWAIGPALAGYMLTYYGFVANIEQAPETIEGLRLMISIIPSGIAIIASLIVMTYGINRELEQQIETELAKRKLAEGTLETE